MKEKNKGFTLIELLAVIVILAIIALIAVPIVMNLITKARLSAAKDSAYGVLKSAQNYYAEKLIDTQGSGFEDVTFTCNGEECFYQGEEKETLKINGTIPTSGTIAVTSTLGAKLTSPLVINDYYCDYVDEAETAIDCATTLANLDNNSEMTPEEIKTSVVENLYPVGSVYISTNAENPETYLGIGKWEAYAQGRTLIGVGEGTDSNSTSQTFTVGQTGGEYSHTLTTNEMPSHSHDTAVKLFGDNSCSTTVYKDYDFKFPENFQISGAGSAKSCSIVTSNISSKSTGTDNAHNNTQPYVAVYMWQRTE